MEETPQPYQPQIQKQIVVREIRGLKQQVLNGEQQEPQEVTLNQPRPIQECFRKKEGLQLQVQIVLLFQQEVLNQAVRKVIHGQQQVRKAELIPGLVVREAAVIPARA